MVEFRLEIEKMHVPGNPGPWSVMTCGPDWAEGIWKAGLTYDQMAKLVAELLMAEGEKE